MGCWLLTQRWISYPNGPISFYAKLKKIIIFATSKHRNEMSLDLSFVSASSGEKVHEFLLLSSLEGSGFTTSLSIKIIQLFLVMCLMP